MGEVLADPVSFFNDFLQCGVHTGHARFKKYFVVDTIGSRPEDFQKEALFHQIHIWNYTFREDGSKAYF